MSRNLTDGATRARFVRTDPPVERIERAGAGRDVVDEIDAERFRVCVRTCIVTTPDDFDDELEGVRCI